MKQCCVALLLLCSSFLWAGNYGNPVVQEALNLRLIRPGLIVNFPTYESGIILDYDQVEDVDVSINESEAWYQRRAMRISYAPATLFLAGALTWPYREDVRDWRNRFIPDYHNTFDDLLQYMPVMAVYGLNWAGVEGKHGLKRTTVTWGMSLAMMGILVNGLKYTTNVMRPDNSSANSFPSGHTAMAFVSATMLHKEFGQYRSPLYSVFGYAAAGWTGTMRQLNNRHWVSDVMVGAGIGILSTEVAYIIAEQIYKDKQTNPEKKYEAVPFSDKRPSFLSFKVGVARPMGDLANNREGAYTSTGFNAGFEGAFFFTRNIGFGGEMSLTSFPISSDKINLWHPGEVLAYIQQPGGGYNITTESMGSVYYMAGPYGFIDLSRKFGVLFNVGAGYSVGAEGRIVADLNEAGQAALGKDELAITTYKPNNAFAWNTGGQLWYKINDRVTLGAYTKFMFNTPKMEIHDVSGIDNEGKPLFDYTETIDFDFSHWSLGISVNAIL